MITASTLKMLGLLSNAGSSFPTMRCFSTKFLSKRNLKIVAFSLGQKAECQT